MQKCVKLVIGGRVQGVSYRASCLNQATQIGNLSGWVRNLSSGEVEVVVQGDEQDVQKLIQWCNQGPQFADVAYANQVPMEPDPHLKTFEVRY